MKKLADFLKECIIEYKRRVLCAKIELFIRGKYSREAVCVIRDDNLYCYVGDAKMNFKMCWEYFKYIIGHKWNVGIECIKTGLYLHAITHDLSKFLPSEFIPYAKFFFSKNRAKGYKQSDENDPNFQAGWNRHQKRNKHHWNYWVSVTRKDEIIPIPMPEKYVKQMICDWRGMSRKFGGTTIDYFISNREKMILHEETIKIIDSHLI